MYLKQFLEEEKISQARLARYLNLSYPHVYRIANRKSSPGLLILLRILEFTGDKVTIEDLLSKSDANKLKKWRDKQQDIRRI